MEATGVPADPNEAATAWSAEPGDDETGAAEDIEWRTIDVGAAQHGQRLDRMLPMPWPSSHAATCSN